MVSKQIPVVKIMKWHCKRHSVLLDIPSDSDTPPKIDLAFAVVASDRVGPFNFRRQQWFVKRMIREFSVSPSGTRVAMVSYATTPKTIFGLNDNVNRECTVEAVEKAK